MRRSASEVRVADGLAYVELTHDQVCVVDEVDATWIKSWCWHASPAANKRGWYARRACKNALGRWSKVDMHRLILSLKIGRDLLAVEEVDHINRNSLDNRRENLRIANRLENTWNAWARYPHGYKGVEWHCGSWRAVVQIAGKSKKLGSFDNIIDAALAYDRAVYETRGEFALANYPRFACGLGGAS